MIKPEKVEIVSDGLKDRIFYSQEYYPQDMDNDSIRRILMCEHTVIDRIVFAPFAIKAGQIAFQVNKAYPSSYRFQITSPGVDFMKFLYDNGNSLLRYGIRYYCIHNKRMQLHALRGNLFLMSLILGGINDS